MKYILIDCSSLAYAAFYAYGPLSYQDQPTGVIFGFLEKTLSIANRLKTNNFVFCWDSLWTYRKEAFWDYKRVREEKRAKETEEEILARLSLEEQKNLLMERIIPELGFKNSFSRSGFEADDLLSVLARKLKRHDVFMVTGDSDLYQCLNHCKIFNPTKNIIYSKKDFEKDYGISPEQWPMAKAIGGCRSDNVPGIFGVSDPKSKSSKALKYLKGELNKKGLIYERITSKKGKEIIERNLPLVTAPFKEEKMKRLIIKRNDFSSKKFISIFEEYGLHSFLKEKKFKLFKEIFLNENNGRN